MDTFTFMYPPESATSGIVIDTPAAIDPIPVYASRFDDLRDAADVAAIGRRLADPAISPRTLGSLGEDYAAAWLASRGWRVLDRNWRDRKSVV